MITFQDYQKAGDTADFLTKAIDEYRSGMDYQTAVIADEYDRQQNRTINAYTKYLYSTTGQKVVDTFASNNKIACNLFHRLNKQRCTYLLGNGVTFAGDTDKEQFGKDFDWNVSQAGYYALIHGVSYSLWNKDHLVVFPATQVCPLYDEEDGTLRACIRFWSLDWQKRPVTVEFYEEDGFSVYKTKEGSTGLDLQLAEPKRGYIQNIERTEADGPVVVGEENYTSLPVIAFYGNESHQSSIIGMRAAIDSYDLIKSGFANDLQDCAQIYWLIGNNFGMDDDETQRFLDRLKLNHVANIDAENSSIHAYTQDIPSNARETFLNMIRRSVYEDFGALDVSDISASAKTATEINAAYQPVDEEADNFEYQAIQYILRLLHLLGIDDMPVFKRNRVSNQLEQTQMITMVSDILDRETMLNLLPFITVDQVQEILERLDREEGQRMKKIEKEQEEDEDKDEDEEEPEGGES